MKKQKLLFIPFCILILSSCVSPYNKLSHKQLTDLKAQHIKFLEDRYSKSDLISSTNPIQEQAYDLDLLFRQAIEYSETTEDIERTDSLNKLHELFLEQYKEVKKYNGALSEIFGLELVKKMKASYNRAIKGEMSRINSPE